MAQRCGLDGLDVWRRHWDEEAGAMGRNARSECRCSKLAERPSNHRRPRDGDVARNEWCARQPLREVNREREKTIWKINCKARQGELK